MSAQAKPGSYGRNIDPPSEYQDLLPAVRDLYSRHPEYRCLQPWELAQVLWSLNYTEDLEEEGDLAAAADVARQDAPEWWRAA
jgi:hypothetical protein